MPDPKTYKQHFENKHPKNDMPDELKDVQAWLGSPVNHVFNKLHLQASSYFFIKFTGFSWF